MPRYEFKCSNQHIEEQVVGFNYDSDAIRCSCGARAVRIFQTYPVGIHFRGGGWGGKPVAPSNTDADAAQETMYQRTKNYPREPGVYNMDKGEPT